MTTGVLLLVSSYMGLVSFVRRLETLHFVAIPNGHGMGVRETFTQSWNALQHEIFQLMTRVGVEDWEMTWSALAVALPGLVSLNTQRMRPFRPQG
jgi:hypothetical protein